MVLYRCQQGQAILHSEGGQPPTALTLPSKGGGDLLKTLFQQFVTEGQAKALTFGMKAKGKRYYQYIDNKKCILMTVVVITDLPFYETDLPKLIDRECIEIESITFSEY